MKATSGSTPNNLSLDEIQRLLSLLRENEVTEFSLERGDEKIFLKRGDVNSGGDISSANFLSTHQKSELHRNIANIQASPEQSSPNTNSTTSHFTTHHSSTQIGDQRKLEPGFPNPRADADNLTATPRPSNLLEIKSPMVGTFYKRNSPDASPFVAVGDRVTKGQILCIIEAMKVMNEIESDASGKVVEILLDDGQVVEFEEVLFRIDPSA